jgi:PhoH-like ATPase
MSVAGKRVVTQQTPAVPGGATRTVVVLDTCVLLADPDALWAFPAADIVLPLTVIEELDEQKARSDEVGYSARTVLRYIEELREKSPNKTLAQAIDLPAGGTLRIEPNGMKLDSINELGMDARKPDNRILAAALGLAEASPVVVYSADAAVRVKAAHLGLGAENYTKVRDGELFLSATTLAAEQTCVDELFDEKTLDLLRVQGAGQLRENGCTIIEGPGRHALARRPNDVLKLVETKRHPWGLRPRSAEQRFALDLLCDDNVPVVALTGHAGTGKTILSLAAALEQVFEPASATYDRLMILRPVVAVGRQELGYLPGDVADKLGPWFEAIIDTMVALGDNVSHREARAILDGWLADDRLTLESVTYLRGRSLQSTYVIVDECQNLEPLVAKTILTRLGKGSKAVLLGDTSQIDSPWLSERNNALAALVDAADGSPLFGHLHLLRGERSPVADLAARVL